MNDLSSPVKFLKGVGPARAKSLQALSIQTVEDLLYYFPRRYEDRKNLISISQIQENTTCTVKARVSAISNQSSWKRRNFSIVRITVSDDTGNIEVVWFNQPYLAKVFQPDQELVLYGSVTRYKGKLQFNAPEFEILDSQEKAQDNLNVGRIVPIYSVSRLLSQRQLRLLIKQALDKCISSLGDYLPYDLRSRLKLFNLAKSLINIHFPQDEAFFNEAYRRLCFDDCFLCQIPILMRKHRRKERPAIALVPAGRLYQEVIKALPFQLTASQQQVLEQIKNDLSKPVPMQRLLQGDVGSGKTVVALLAGLIAIEAGVQVALMVPTEIIAKQHLRVLQKMTKGFRSQVHIGLLSGSLTLAQKQSLYKKVKKGHVNLVIGTHALLSEGLQFKSLGLVVIDEQHKFGVEQRARISQKTHTEQGDFWPHCLIMTATPIPRTLAMTIYGDLDISVLTEFPPERKPVKTMLFSQGSVEEAYEFLKNIIREKRQGFIVYPLIEESQHLDLKAAMKMFEELKTNYFKDFNLGLIHSRVKEKGQDRIMHDFASGKIDILVATSILEVGVDVAKADCMLIEEADRFGLATLHQLRGRVGRSSAQGYCLIVSSASSEEAKKRINAITSLSDGFKIAEADLKIRGPGQFLGSLQHGLSDLKIADPLRQMHILKNAREEAIRLLTQDPRLELQQHSALAACLKRRYPGFETLVMTG
jgi:ATP-dependent DNA helicase RecG